jgi:hypothetical protein
MRVFADASLFVHLNVPMPDEQAQLVDSLWRSLSSPSTRSSRTS